MQTTKNKNRRRPIQMVQISIRSPEKVLADLKKKGWKGYVASDDTLWLRGSKDSVSKVGGKVIKEVG